MTLSQNVPDLVATARAEAKTFEDTIVQSRDQVEAQTATDAQIDAYRAANKALELAAVDTFTLFEARMQHHFKRGPFSRKLKSALLEAGERDLAGSIHAFYLAVNVLKHGKGASYRELLSLQSPLFQTNKVDSDAVQDDGAPSILIDLAVPDFFDGLTAALLGAHQFLENR